jgi:hypothetical protein
MDLQIGQTFRTPAGLLLKVKKIGAVEVHTFWLVDEKGEIVPERKNSFGHVVTRNIRVCTEEAIRTFKKVKK